MNMQSVLFGPHPKPPFVALSLDIINHPQLELRTSYLTMPLVLPVHHIQANPHNFDALENRACDICHDLDVPIVYTEAYLELKNEIQEKEQTDGWKEND